MSAHLLLLFFFPLSKNNQGGDQKNGPSELGELKKFYGVMTKKRRPKAFASSDLRRSYRGNVINRRDQRPETNGIDGFSRNSLFLNQARKP